MESGVDTQTFRLLEPLLRDCLSGDELNQLANQLCARQCMSEGSYRAIKVVEVTDYDVSTKAKLWIYY